MTQGYIEISRFYFQQKVILPFIVATTRPVSNSSTSNKSQGWISSEEHELCNSQENSTENHNSILPTIYINYPWSMLWLHICYASYPNVHALSSYSLLIFHVFTLRPACCIHVPWHHILNPTLNLHRPCMYHIYTIRKPCCQHVFWCHFIFRLLILLDYRSF